MAQLPIKLQPGAAADRIDGWDADPDGRRVLKVRVRARPVDGEANVALIKLLAKTLGYAFLDTDLVIQAREGALLQQLLDARGQEAFLEAEADAVIALAKQVMERAAEPAVAFSVPLVVEARAAANWDDAH